MPERCSVFLGGIVLPRHASIKPITQHLCNDSEGTATHDGDSEFTQSRMDHELSLGRPCTYPSTLSPSGCFQWLTERRQAPLAMGGFATTLLSVSLAMMNFRGVTTQTIFIGNLCFVACIGLLISAQWSMVKGDTFSYTVLTAFGKMNRNAPAPPAR